MHIPRLERMAALLDANAANPKGVQFNVRQWAAPAGSSEGDAHFPTNHKVKVDCGTMACGMGLAALSGEFVKDGLSYNLIGSEAGGYMLLPTFRDDNHHYAQEGFDAAEALFAIDMNDAEYLFDGGCYPTDQQKGAKGERAMAQRIRDFIAGKIDPKRHPDTKYD